MEKVHHAWHRLIGSQEWTTTKNVQPDEDCAPKLEQDEVPKCDKELTDEEVIGSHNNQDEGPEEPKVDSNTETEEPNQPELQQDQNKMEEEKKMNHEKNQTMRKMKLRTMMEMWIPRFESKPMRLTMNWTMFQ